MISKQRHLANWVLAIIAGFSLLFNLPASAQSRKRSRTHHHRARRPAAHKTVRHSRRHRVARRRVSRRRRARARRRRIHLSDQRVTEIQQALAKAGYLKGKVDGKWGPVTAEAMRRFQQANGFDATGLPEAKTLMKLGLGPHPLPPALDSTVANSGATQASADAAPSASSQDSASNNQNKK